MGIVYKQSFRNSVSLVVGFTIGGINTLFLYTHFLDVAYYGLTIFLLSTANILMPLMVFGMQHAVVKFYSSYESKLDRDALLSWSLMLPILVVIPLGIIGILCYEYIIEWIATKNSLIEPYSSLIFICAIFMGYFEVFYAWTKVHLNSVFGNLVREVFARVGATLLLIGLYFELLSPELFIYGIVVVYGLRTLIMCLYALKVYTPKIRFTKPKRFNEIIRYAIYLILAGSAGTLLLEIDKFMIPQVEIIDEVAYYAVGVYIASVIAIPNRAMHQITYPITAKYLNENKLDEVRNLYKKSSINLLIAGGLLLLLINLNIDDMYRIINKPEYAGVSLIVLMISVSELMKLTLGTNGAILSNSKYYKVLFYLSLAMAFCVIVLNKQLITWLGINGAALATLITVLLFSWIKIIYIFIKLKMHPFSVKSILALIVILLVGGIGCFISFDFHPVINIVLKSSMLFVVYISLVLLFRLSEDVTNFFNKLVLKKD